jgi:hypothetical protein
VDRILVHRLDRLDRSHDIWHRVLALGIYLALWIQSKGRSALPLLGFLSVVFATVLDKILGHFSMTLPFSDIAGILVVFVWIGSTYALRHEIKRYYKEAEGWEIEIGPVFTFLFSVVYINYCLNRAMLDYSSNKGTTSLNLNSNR